MSHEYNAITNNHYLFIHLLHMIINQELLYTIIYYYILNDYISNSINTRSG